MKNQRDAKGRFVKGWSKGHDKIEKICKYCEKVFIAKHNKRVYCSRKCLHLWRSKNLRGKNHPNWKENPTNYNWKHRRMEKLIIKPNLCDRCKKVPPVDLANKSGKYLMDVSDWEYLCRKCHMESDGRNNVLRKYGYASRKYPDKNCLNCNKIFRKKSGMKIVKFCSRKCMSAYQIQTGIKKRQEREAVYV